MIRKAYRTVPLFVIDQLLDQVHRFVVQKLLEFGARYFVGGQVLSVLVVPVEFDSSFHTLPIVSQRIYVGAGSVAFGPRACYSERYLHLAAAVLFFPV